VTQASTVLVLGDLGGEGDRIAWLLRISGYHAAIVPDAASAEMFLAQHHPALIVARLRHMAWDPRDPLDEFLAALLAANPETRVLLISDDAATARSEIKSGVVEGILPRPLDAGKFCSAVHRAMNRTASQAAG
jgi:DNA-binding NtrC family response regulator